MSTNSSPAHLHPHAGAALARRLERAEGAANAAFVEARARIAPASGAAWIDVAGCYAMFDGLGSPITQTFGLALFSPASEGDLETIEAFFAAQGSPVFHEVSPLADPAHLTLLGARGYRPIELTTVLHLPLAPPGDAPPAAAAPARADGSPGVVARRMRPEEIARWTDAAAQGLSETAGISDFMHDFGMVVASARGVHTFVGELEGEIVATGSLCLHEGVALLAGASTIPAWRGRGAQTALLAERLRFARAHGCDLAMVCTAPGSTSQANSERQGFRVAYTRTKWEKPR